jgi:hypothetical protein
MMRTALLLLAFAAVGCGKTMTDDSCRRVGENMLQIWQSESAKAASTDGADSDKARNVIKSEGDKLVNDWSTECKKELLGRRVDPKELDCVLRATSIEQINTCAKP